MFPSAELRLWGFPIDKCSATSLRLIPSRISKFSFSYNRFNFNNPATVKSEENPYNPNTTKIQNGM
jgi:hypothetical protein